MSISVSVEDGFSFQEFKAYMEGFAAGAADAAQRAINIRLSQLSKTINTPDATAAQNTVAGESDTQPPESTSVRTSSTFAPGPGEVCRPVLVDNRSA